MLKKLISAFLRPTGMVILIWSVGFIFWWLAIRKAKKAPLQEEAPEKLVAVPPPRSTKICFLIAPLLLYLFSIQPVSDWLCCQVEKKVVPLSETQDAGEIAVTPSRVVVLAGGARDSNSPVSSRLSYQALGRLVGAVDLWKLFPESQLIFTGTSRETEAMRAFAEQLSVPAESIWEETESRDTKDHAIHLKPVLGDEPFLLVTSATHLPRALALFRGQDLDPTPAPVDFISRRGGGGDFSFRSLLPKAIFCHRSETAVHEMIGLVWAWLRGQLG